MDSISDHIVVDSSLDKAFIKLTTEQDKACSKIFSEKNTKLQHKVHSLESEIYQKNKTIENLNSKIATFKCVLIPIFSAAITFVIYYFSNSIKTIATTLWNKYWSIELVIKALKIIQPTAIYLLIFGIITVTAFAVTKQNEDNDE